jgi:hypothetical protein
LCRRYGFFLLVVVLAGLAVAFAVDLRPGRDTAAAARFAALPPELPATDAVVQARESGTLGLAVAARRSGSKVGVQVTVIGPNATGVDGLRLSVGAPGRLRRASPCGSGCYSARLPLRRPLAVVVRGAGPPQRFDFPGRFPPRRADALMRRVTRSFRARKSVEFVERLASGPTNAVVSTFVLQRPNRLSFHTRGGHEAIIIGGKRWDREPGRPWLESPQTPLPQPTPTWRTKLTNAYVLSSTRTTYDVAFIDRTSNAFAAWFELAINRKTLLPKTLKMTAASHFMHQTFAAYDRAPRIRPPH